MNYKELELSIELYENKCELIDDNFEDFIFDETDFELLDSEDLEGVEYYE